MPARGVGKNAVRRVGILGGTFDPIHNGHVIMAQTVLKKMNLDRVVFVPCRRPPHKVGHKVTPVRHRLSMIRSAIRGHAAFTVSDFEAKRPGKSYSIDTIRHLQGKYPPGTKLYFIVGQDACGGINKWRNSRDILQLVEFIVVNRPGYLDRSRGPEHVPVPIPDMDISSSDVRRLVIQGYPVDRLVPRQVAEYISRHRLYRKKR